MGHPSSWVIQLLSVSQNKGIICWFIWKTYSGLIWGSLTGIPTAENTIWQIKLYTQNWVLSMSNMKLRTIDKILYEERLIPEGYHLAQRILKPIRWIKPKNGLKLNIDAAFIPGRASGGAILRNERGKMLRAISFPVAADSSLEAEWKALIQ
ncbi:unnamed protein product, partial [Cuscuta epithymum]